MCVIIVCQEAKPSRKILEECEETNPFGGGVAWRDGDLVRWKKDLKGNEIEDMVKELPLPFVLHFRIPSTGKSLPELCHPFPIGAVSNALEGSTKGGVLFHNGTWNTWRFDTKQAVITQRAKMPAGHWSDTRAMAWMVGIYGLGFLELLDERVVVFGTTGLRMFGGPWHEHEKMAFSNLAWRGGRKTTVYTATPHGYTPTAPTPRSTSSHNTGRHVVPQDPASCSHNRGFTCRGEVFTCKACQTPLGSWAEASKYFHPPAVSTTPDIRTSD